MRVPFFFSKKTTNYCSHILKKIIIINRWCMKIPYICITYVLQYLRNAMTLSFALLLLRDWVGCLFYFRRRRCLEKSTKNLYGNFLEVRCQKSRGGGIFCWVWVKTHEKTRTECNFDNTLLYSDRDWVHPKPRFWKWSKCQRYCKTLNNHQNMPKIEQKMKKSLHELALKTHFRLIPGTRKSDFGYTIRQ